MLDAIVVTHGPDMQHGQTHSHTMQKGITRTDNKRLSNGHSIGCAPRQDRHLSLLGTMPGPPKERSVMEPFTVVVEVPLSLNVKHVGPETLIYF